MKRRLFLSEPVHRVLHVDDVVLRGGAGAVLS
jgi:hypothetical protein